MKLPNGGKTPAFLQMMQWITQPFAFMESCAERYGDLFVVPLANKFTPLVFTSNPQALQEILSPDSKQFEAPGEKNVLFEPILGKKSVIMASGDRHKRQRQLMMPPFHGERMRSYGQLISDISEEVINSWEIGKPFSVRESMQKISLRVILRAVFGLEEGQRYQQLEQLLSSMLDEISTPLGATMLYFPALRQDLGAWSPWGHFQRKQQQTDKLIYAEIQERRDQPDSSRTDILSMLMSAYDEKGQPMTDLELRDELMTLLFAGHETTANALTWALYWIHKLPTVRQKLVTELDSIGDRPDSNAVIKLPYLNAVCSETLRIYPVAMLTFPRVATSPCTLMGYDIDQGAIVIGSIYLTHQREDLYPEPKQFKPERFLERQFSAYEYLPFGGGSRRCIGMAFAQFEMKVVLAKILSTFDLAIADHRPVKPLRRGLVSAPSEVKLTPTAQHSQTSAISEFSANRV